MKKARENSRRLNDERVWLVASHCLRKFKLCYYWSRYNTRGSVTIVTTIYWITVLELWSFATGGRKGLKPYRQLGILHPLFEVDGILYRPIDNWINEHNCMITMTQHVQYICYDYFIIYPRYIMKIVHLCDICETMKSPLLSIEHYGKQNLLKYITTRY